VSDTEVTEPAKMCEASESVRAFSPISKYSKAFRFFFDKLGVEHRLVFDISKERVRQP